KPATKPRTCRLHRTGNPPPPSPGRAVHARRRSSPPGLAPGERSGDAGDQRLAAPEDLAPGDPDDMDAVCGEKAVAVAVGLELALRGVEREAVDLDDEVLGAPEEVDPAAPDVRVQLGQGELGRPDQRQEAFLRLRLGEPGRCVLEDLTQRRSARPPAVAVEEREDLGPGRELPALRQSACLLELAGAHAARDV